MKQIILLAALATTVYFTSCVGSLYPLTETKSDMLFKQQLIGRWKEQGDPTQYLIEKLSDSEHIYKLTIIETRKDQGIDTNYFKTILVRLQSNYYLDCWPNPDKPAFPRIGETAKEALLPIHFIYKIDFTDQNSIVLSLIDREKFSTLLKQKKMAFKHEDLNKNNLLLTEKPSDLQKKLVELNKFSSVFERTTLIQIH